MHDVVNRVETEVKTPTDVDICEAGRTQASNLTHRIGIYLGATVPLAEFAAGSLAGVVIVAAWHALRARLGPVNRTARRIIPALAHAIAIVVALGAYKEVRRPDASTVVAGMEGTQPGPDRAVCDLPRESMGGSACAESSIAGTIDVGRPYPATPKMRAVFWNRTASIYLAPKSRDLSVCDRSSLSHTSNLLVFDVVVRIDGALQRTVDPPYSIMPVSDVEVS